MLKILGVKIDNLSKKEILNKLECFLNEDGIHQVATINPEFILQAQKDSEFKKILNNCELRVADGAGIWFAYLRFGRYLKNRFTGIDIVQEVLRIANEKNIAIFLIASESGLSNWEKTREAILEKYPNLKIQGSNVDRKDAQRNLSAINCPIVLCALGAPYQEKLIHSLKLAKNDKIRLAIGVGGSFDFLTNKLKRAPKIMRKTGLEWLWRFGQEPRYRMKRICSAIFVFPVRILFNK